MRGHIQGFHFYVHANHIHTNSTKKGNDFQQQENYQSRFAVWCLSEVDNCGFGCCSAGSCSGGGKRRSQHHSSEGCGSCCSRLSAGLRQQALMDEGF